MKYKIAIFLIISFLAYIFYSLFFPGLKIINNTNNIIRATKGEFKNKNSDPDLDEVEDMFDNIVYIKPNESYTYNISMKSLINNEKIRVDVSYEKEGLVSGRSFIIGDSGSCKYKINIYDGYNDIETRGLDICYRKLSIAEDDI
ncbi:MULTISPECIES: hypothetical protein [unclassified Psychrobacter]|uniref:hypothetical protein n=1 Tax=unclassified Psychrobacter TaxID=196806 RepID=UPI0018F770A3|nr:MULTISPECIES: hypothetical protein [unclassified Psychrobacter]